MDLFIDNSFITFHVIWKLSQLEQKMEYQKIFLETDTESEDVSSGSSDNYNPDSDKNEYSSSMSDDDDERKCTEEKAKRASKVI